MTVHPRSNEAKLQETGKENVQKNVLGLPQSWIVTSHSPATFTTTTTIGKNFKMFLIMKNFKSMNMVILE